VELEAPQLAPQPIPVGGGRTDVTGVALRVTLVVLGVLISPARSWLLTPAVVIAVAFVKRGWVRAEGSGEDEEA
jgi:hypothetical protein